MKLEDLPTIKGSDNKGSLEIVDRAEITLNGKDREIVFRD